MLDQELLLDVLKLIRDNILTLNDKIDKVEQQNHRLKGRLERLEHVINYGRDDD